MLLQNVLLLHMNYWDKHVPPVIEPEKKSWRRESRVDLSIPSNELRIHLKDNQEEMIVVLFQKLCLLN